MRGSMKVEPLEILSPQDLERLHEETLVILAQTGVEVHDVVSRDLLAGAGARVRVNGCRVRIGAEVVASALATAPKEAMVYDRRGQPAMRLAPGYGYFGTGSDVTWVIDPETGERRPTDLDTTRMTTRLTDALPNLDFAMSMGRARDDPPHTADQQAFAAMVESTTKPIVFTAQTAPAVEAIARICAVVAGGGSAFREHPFAVLYAMPTSPLAHSAEALAAMRSAAEAGRPSSPYCGDSG